MHSDRPAGDGQPSGDGTETVVRIDTAVGLVEATARFEGGRVRWVRVRNVPSFALALDRPIVVPEYGTITADIAFGGQFYVLARAADMGVDLGPEHAPATTRAGTALLAAAREQVPIAHPERPDITEIGLVVPHGPADTPGISGRNSVILPSGPIKVDDPAAWTGTVDRSPGGTGTSARMATLHAHGELGLDVPFVHQGVLGTAFHGMSHERTTVGDYEALVPSIRGRAGITGYVHHVLQPDDPFPTGLTVGDIWSPLSDRCQSGTLGWLPEDDRAAAVEQDSALAVPADRAGPSDVTQAASSSEPHSLTASASHSTFVDN